VGIITKIDPIDDLYRSDELIPYPVPESDCPDAQSSGTQGCSKHFGARFRVDGLSQILSVFGLHFLAFPADSGRCLRREGQATVIAELVRNEVANGNAVMVAGDLNDFAESVCDIACNRPISGVESILRSAGDLVNVAERISMAEQRYSSWWNCDGDCVVKEECLSMIDQVLMSRNALFDAVRSVRFDHGFESGCGSMYSDHWPLVIELELNRNRNRMGTMKSAENDSVAVNGTVDEKEKDDGLIMWKDVDWQSRWAMVSVLLVAVIIVAVTSYFCGFRNGMNRERNKQSHHILTTEPDVLAEDDTVRSSDEMQTELIRRQ